MKTGADAGDRAINGTRSRFGLIAALALITLLCGGAASAALIKIPLRIDYLTLDQAVQAQAYTGPDGQAQLWQGANNCEYLHATNPVFSQNGTVVRFETNGELAIGVPVGSTCVSPVHWSGIIQLDAIPYLTPGLALRFHVSDINLYDLQHRKTLLVGRGFDLIKGRLIPLIEGFSFDLKPPLVQLQELVREAATPAVAIRVKAALTSLRPVPPVVVESGDVHLTLEMTVPEAIAPVVASGPVPPLTPAQIAAWQTTLDNWDAFTVFAIKQLGLAVNDPTIRKQLFELLTESRYRLVAALARPENLDTGPDPVRILFLATWTRLGDIVREAARRGLLRNRALEFLDFISAGDALFALDQAAPALGMRVSANDLRRLARIMAPTSTTNPLVYDYTVDPQLQKLFGLTEPASTAGPLEIPGAVPAQPERPSGAPPSPSASPGPAAVPSPVSMLSRGLELLGLGTAVAAEESPVTELDDLGQHLRLVVVNESNVDRYKRDLRKLLMLTAQRAMRGDPIAPRDQQTYAMMVRAVAWQESCWRQFVRRDGRVRYLQSPTGDIGLMQVNRYVWRGMFSLPRLEWDIVYNAGAGAEILMKLMQGALANGVKDQDALTRSTYAAYNGGPDEYDRWRKPHEAERTREIDRAFWRKYRVVRQGLSFDIMTCAANWSRTH
ncbi:MAG: lytic transglycosylase domain-containing protein [Candidatus Binataceae bacterium]